MSVIQLILASASPRRRELLDQLGVKYICDPAHIDEAQRAAEIPSHYVQRMAQEKARAVAIRYPAPACVVLAADTTVVIDDTVLGKPQDRNDALAILASLSGRSHLVLTAVCLLGVTGMHCALVETEVEFMSLSREVCEAYLATAEPWDKAGAYGIQGLGGAFVRSIHGSYSNVVGLPLCETWQLLSANGVSTALTSSASS
ncbi:MAG TPA: Maf family protein [Halioglobus sp.]